MAIYDTAQGSNIKELRIATIGNVDAGKSTLTSVLTLGIPDDGRGAARTRIMKNPHEIESGRSSTISNYFIRANDPLKPDRQLVIDFRDLAGHNKYLKTTLRGMCRPLDYAMLVIAANDGIMEMTREHFRLSLNLRIPLFIVITKIDMVTPNMIETVRNQITNILNGGCAKNKKTKTNNIKGRTAVFLCNGDGDFKIKLNMVMDAYSNGDFHKYIPVFEVSSKPNYNETSVLNTASIEDIIMIPGENSSTSVNANGVSKVSHHNYRGKNSISDCQGILDLFNYITRLPVYQNYNYLINKPAAYFVEKEYQVKGVGLVLSGIVMTGEIKKGDKLRLGPFYDKFHNVIVRSIHNNFREEVNSLSTGCSGCLAIRIENNSHVTRRMIKAGMRVVAPGAELCLYWCFKARVLVQKHPTSITEGYSTVVHCGAVNQSARMERIITDKEHKVLRLGDRAEVIFRFQIKPEYIQPGMRLVFRDGTTKGVGEVVCTLDTNNHSPILDD